MNTKAILTSTLLSALLVGVSANADMRGDLDDSVQSSSQIQEVSPAAVYTMAGDLNDDHKSSAKIVKVSLQTPAVVDAQEVNR